MAFSLEIWEEFPIARGVKNRHAWVKMPRQPQDSTFPVGWFADPKIGRAPNSLS
jgi:hypothetical protein